MKPAENTGENIWMELSAMPELPEVETIARTLAPQVEGKFLSGCEVLRERSLQAGNELLPLLHGAKAVKVRRRAKLLLLDVEDQAGAPLLMAFHLKMTGKVFVHPAGTLPHKHTKLVFGLSPRLGAEAESLMFFDDMRTFGYCRLMRPESVSEWPFWAKLGIEPLESAPEEIAEALMGKGLKSGVKAALLNQELVVGVGNIYADEALFRAGIRPDARVGAVGRQRLIELGFHLCEILREAITACGSSIRDYRDAEGNAGAFQNNFRAYGRAGQPCVNCGRTLAGARVAGRGTSFCEHCQS